MDLTNQQLHISKTINAIPITLSRFKRLVNNCERLFLEKMVVLMVMQVRIADVHLNIVNIPD